MYLLKTPSQYFSLVSRTRKRNIRLHCCSEALEITGTIPNIIMCLLKLFLTLAIVLLFKNQQTFLQLLHSLARVLGGLPKERHDQAGLDWFIWNHQDIIFHQHPLEIFLICALLCHVWNYLHIFQLYFSFISDKIN